MLAQPLIATRSFIEATRDSGYKSTSSAIAELVDNSFEADATVVEITIVEGDAGIERVAVTDDGTGMPASTMQLALQFGGSTRFNSRHGSGRYGMGLPNGSLSQARRVDLYSWTSPDSIWSSYLDVDEISSGELDHVPPPVSFKPHRADGCPSSPSGTTVVLTKCDRMDYRTVSGQARHLHFDLGRIFRHQLYRGRSIRINEEPVSAIDPLFLRQGNNLVGAKPYGPPLTYEISLPGRRSLRSPIRVEFAILPIERWHSLSNEEKNRFGISKGAGVSIVRAEREIDHGWYFMGSKRKENYDDWWRCEISFSPELDELFGVTHTKQKVNPTEPLTHILGGDLERIARELNGIVRKSYLAVRKQRKHFKSESIAEERDHLMEPIRVHCPTSGAAGRRFGVNGSRLGYVIDEASANALSFYVPSLVRENLKIVLNKDHSFYHKVYEPLLGAERVEPALMMERLQLLLLAAARAECGLRSKTERATAEKLRAAWSNALTAFLD
ncbi:MAG: ATP-binding protein [Acidobacteria bacterium]|nr:ATP-binding protein [Acidobacteriota bacterium]